MPGKTEESLIDAAFRKTGIEPIPGKPKRKKRMDREHDILKAFIESKQLEGSWDKELPIPDRDAKYVNVYSWKKCVGPFTRRMDAVCVDAQSRHHIIEVKVKLNPAALGQLLCYRRLYAGWKNLREADIRLVAVCSITDSSLEPVYEQLGIKIFKQPMPKDNQCPKQS